MHNKDKNHIINRLTSEKIHHDPFFHIEIENFVPTEIAEKLSKDFLDYEDDKWFCYKNKIEDKKLLSDWRQFPETTYQFLSFLNSSYVLETLSNIVDSKLHADYGLHGGGWHIHASGGKLNPHLDYSIHPTLKLQRKLNLILYLCEDWQDKYGGHFGLWGCQDNGKVAQIKKEIPMGFNKAVLFDTTQNSWHGLSREVNCPSGNFRKSIAVYYLQEPVGKVSSRSRALFTPTDTQKGDRKIEDLIKKRSDLNQSKDVYIDE